MTELPFTEFLKKKGVKQATITILEEEEITDYTTLKALTEEDINGLNLKVGQKALIRNLTVGGKSRMKGMSYISSRYFVYYVEFLSCFNFVNGLCALG